METQSVTPQSANTTAMDETEIAHFAGVFDKGGSITVRVANSSDYEIEYDYRPICSLSHPKREDDLLMASAVAYCEEHDVRHTVTQQSRGSDFLTVTKAGDIKRFLKPLLPYFVSKIKPANIMLEEVLPEYEDGRHRTRQGFYEMMGAADRLREYTSSGSLKYDQDFFAEKWSVVE